MSRMTALSCGPTWVSALAKPYGSKSGERTKIDVNVPWRKKSASSCHSQWGKSAYWNNKIYSNNKDNKKKKLFHVCWLNFSDSEGVCKWLPLENGIELEVSLSTGQPTPHVRRRSILKSLSFRKDKWSEPHALWHGFCSYTRPWKHEQRKTQPVLTWSRVMSSTLPSWVLVLQPSVKRKASPWQWILYWISFDTADSFRALPVVAGLSTWWSLSYSKRGGKKELVNCLVDNETCLAKQTDWCV